MIRLHRRAPIVRTAATAVVGLAVSWAAACGGAPRGSSAPLSEGSASVKASPARAERVPSDEPTPLASAAPSGVVH